MSPPKTVYSLLNSEHVDALRTLAGDGYLYLGSPYSKYPAQLGSMDGAFRDICKISGAFVQHGISAFSPIAHTHPIAMHGCLDPLDHKVWLQVDGPMMRCARGMVVATMEGWEDSFGLAHEIAHFETAGKPIIYLDKMWIWLALGMPYRARSLGRE